ncbi:MULTISPECIES: dienelactone hydrolase [unclassified Rhizobium]|uniref:alpha/beta hydrolase family protein n=1 Tax=unclassified Rhizobium TaxID=2613769 RepID=UPI0014484577|nr:MULTISPECIES: dienelactone hydrolase [unclassified Rhizobium]NKJ04230.1 putative dienelactone hydrolase [Rhizobium sp. SG741]NKJ35570.1 putative dienelactone hydrolase [Rhizobium sp. SG570]
MKRLLKFLAIMFPFFVAGSASAVGFQYLSIPDDIGRPIELGIWYPSNSVATPTTLGDVAQTVAVNGEITGDHLPTVIFSHGSAGHFSDRSESALVLAKAGFVAVSLTYPGDNYKDSGDKVVQILLNRPRQTSRVLDYMMQTWPGREHLEKSEIGFYGFSAGGFTGLVAIGGIPDWKLFTLHCAADPMEAVCQQGSAAVLSRPQVAARMASEWRHDARIKAAVLVSPGWAFSFDPSSLSKIKIPVELWGGSEDHVVPFESNVGYLQRYLPRVIAVHDVRDARHYSFLKPCSKAAGALNLEICLDQPGFDRASFQESLNQELVRFFRSELAE